MVSGSFNHELLGDLSFSESTEVNTHKEVSLRQFNFKVRKMNLRNKVGYFNFKKKNSPWPYSWGYYSIA